jgi:hypothetical protein
MTSPHAVLSAEELALYDAGYRLGKAAGLAEGALRRETPDGAPNGPLDLDAIEARANAASPGPWALIYRGIREEYDVASVATFGDLSGTRGMFERKADAVFVAHAPSDVTLLVRRVRELEAERDRLTARVAELENVLREASKAAGGVVLCFHDWPEHESAFANEERLSALDALADAAANARDVLAGSARTSRRRAPDA